MPSSSIINGFSAALCGGACYFLYRAALRKEATLATLTEAVSAKQRAERELAKSQLECRTLLKERDRLQRECAQLQAALAAATQRQEILAEFSGGRQLGADLLDYFTCCRWELAQEGKAKEGDLAGIGGGFLGGSGRQPQASTVQAPGAAAPDKD